MRKITSLFALLLLCAVTATAQTSVTVISSGSDATTYGSLSGTTFTTNATSGMAGVTVDGIKGTTATSFAYGACLALTSTSSGTITMTAPSGYVITGYTLTARSNTFRVPYTLTPSAGGTAVETTTSGVELSASGLSDQTASFTYSAASANNFYIPSMVISVADANATIVNVTYALYDSSDPSTLVSSVVVSQEANSAVSVPASLQNTAFYDYTVSGTIGDTDCTIVVTRTQKAGTILKVGDLNSSKAYTISTYDRGSWYVPSGATQVTGTTKAGVSVDATSAAQQFAFVSYGGNYYLYSISEAKFISKDGNYTTLTSQPGDNVTLLASSGSSTHPVVVALSNGAYQCGISNGYNPAVITHYNDLADAGNRVLLTEVDDFDPTNALAALDNYFNPSATVTYVISDANGVVYTSSALPATVNETISELPSSFQRAYCSYSVTSTTIVAGDNTVPVTVTYSLPFTVSTTYADAVWHYATIRSTKYLRADDSNLDGSGRYATSTTNEKTDAYKWAFFGDPYNNFYVMNMAQGDGKYLYAGTNPEFQTLTDPTSVDAALWAVSVNGAGFSLRSITGDNLYINDAGGAGNLGYWNSSAGATDAGSRIVATVVPTASEEYDALIAQLEAIPYGTGLNQYSLVVEGSDRTTQATTIISGLKTQGYSAENLTKAQLMLSGTSLNMPTGKFIKLYNAARNAWIGAASSGKHPNASSAEEAGIYYVSSDGQIISYAYGKALQNAAGAPCVSNPGTAGGTFTISDAGNGTYYFYCGGYLVAWTSASDRNSSPDDYAKFTLTEVTELPFTISAAGQATLALPTAWEVPAGVTVRYASVEHDGLLTVEDATATAVAANEAVILVGTPGNYTITLAASGETLGSILTSTNNGGVSVPAETKAYILALNSENKVVFSLLNDSDRNIAGFKAYYISTAAGAAPAFLLLDEGDVTGINAVNAAAQNGAAVYDLQGRRVSNAQKGVYIVNGQKVLVK